MRVITWNSNGAFRKKFDQLLYLNADIYVILKRDVIEM